MKTIVSRYLASSVTKPARMVATDNDGNKVTSSYDDSKSNAWNHDAIVRKLCRKFHWSGSLQSGPLLKNGTLIGTVWVWIDGDQIQTIQSWD
jgi:hypothetical protein